MKNHGGIDITVKFIKIFLNVKVNVVGLMVMDEGTQQIIIGNVRVRVGVCRFRLNIN